jgi:hypothetical protein
MAYWLPDWCGGRPGRTDTRRQRDASTQTTTVDINPKESAVDHVSLTGLFAEHHTSIRCQIRAMSVVG